MEDNEVAEEYFDATLDIPECVSTPQSISTTVSSSGEDVILNQSISVPCDGKLKLDKNQPKRITRLSANNSIQLDDDMKRKLLSKVPCTNLGTCEGPPGCFAYHPPDYVPDRVLAKQKDIDENTRRSARQQELLVKKTNVMEAGKEKKQEIQEENSKKNTCPCNGIYDTKFMIQCDGSCQGWFHGECIGISEEAANGVSEYFCAKCRPEMKDKSSPSDRRNSRKKKSGKGTFCSPECQESQDKLKLRASKLMTEKTSVKQELDTVKAHQTALRSTIESHSATIEAQKKIIEDVTMKMESQKRLISEQGVELQSHCKLAISFMDECLEEEEQDNDDGRVSTKQSQDARVKDMLEAAKERVSKFSDENAALTENVSALKAELGDCKEEVKGCLLNANQLQEKILCQEKENEVLQKEVSRLRHLLDRHEEKTARMCAEMDQLKKGHIEWNSENNVGGVMDKDTINRLEKHIKDKDREIYDLQETLAYTEKAEQDTKRQNFLAEEKIAIMQEQWHQDRETLTDYRSKYCDMKLANQELERKISSLQTKFERKNAISSLQTPVVNQENGVRNAKVQNVNIYHKSTEAKINQKSTDNISGNDKQSSKDEEEPKEQCVFELNEEGSCTRRKCNFSHEIKPEMRKDQSRIKKLQELSQKEKKCMFEMVKKGWCQAGDLCGTNHDVYKKKGGGKRQLKEKQYCFKEVEKANSCQRQKCRFSHDIPADLRDNKEFVKKVQGERALKKSICINEYRREGSCRHKKDCSFRHEISQEERNDVNVQEKMSQTWTRIRSKSQEKSSNMENVTHQQILAWMVNIKELLAKNGICP